VLITGGFGVPASAELYDPAAGTFSATGSLGVGRIYHSATELPNGKVLIAGGQTGNVSLASAELYDPALGTFSSTGSLATARDTHSASLLSNGKVLVTGGDNNNTTVLGSAELYDAFYGGRRRAASH
jgi:hypothetical protein